MGKNSGSDQTPDLPVAVERAAEQELVRRCRAGERAAHDEFYRQHRRAVAATLFRVLNDRADLDDLTQEVFIIAFRGLATFRGDARIGTWLYRICVNVALGRIRSRSRRPPPIPIADPFAARADASATAAAGDSPETPERLMERKQSRDYVHSVMARLGPKKRIVFYLHEIEGLNLNEIAAIVGAHPVTVRTRLFYARKEFYRRIAEDSR